MPATKSLELNLVSLLARGLLWEVVMLPSEHADDLGDLEGDLCLSCILLEAIYPGANSSFAGNAQLNHKATNSKP